MIIRAAEHRLRLTAAERTKRQDEQTRFDKRADVRTARQEQGVNTLVLAALDSGNLDVAQAIEVGGLVAAQRLVLERQACEARDLKRRQEAAWEQEDEERATMRRGFGRG